MASAACVAQLNPCSAAGPSAGPAQGTSFGGPSRVGRGAPNRPATEARWAYGGVSSSSPTAASVPRAAGSSRPSGLTSRHGSPPGNWREAWRLHGLSRSDGAGNAGPDDYIPSQQRQTIEPPYTRQTFRSGRYPAAYPEDEKPVVKVRLSVHYRCHSRQMLCIGGSNIPFGWSFLSIAKVPMSWTDGDNWITEVTVPAGTRLEYKYVILEEQDWTKQENQDVEGVVTTEYRVNKGELPDVQMITKKMAIVAWQPGPNRVLMVPAEEEFAGMVPGESREREFGPMEEERAAAASRGLPRNDVIYGSSEEVILQRDSMPVLDRKDIWGYGDWNQRQQGSRSRF
mmetsp:Transcript_1032/g.2393  ORF Transcript_1032/g.2393 Transcript_1032/m.2393 type:complete len:341 (+) Transcript_1032:184-1206(+)